MFPGHCKKNSYVGVCAFRCLFYFLFEVGKKRDCEFVRAETCGTDDACYAGEK